LPCLCAVQLGIFCDTIIVCTVTGSTYAGMIAGFAALQENAHGRPRRVLGIDASATLKQTRDQVARIARHTGKLMELGRDLTDDEITVLDGWAWDLYGIPVDSTIEAIRLSGSLEGMIVDPVYEGKSLVSSGEPEGLHRPLRPPRRAAGAQRLRGHLRLNSMPRNL
jgi:1-aminocyclopropane-1-carboxylate deaminase